MTTFGNLSRSELMSRVRGKYNYTTELKLVKLLRNSRLCGWRRHYKTFGNPDFVWLNFKIAVFVDGCFWHGHNCARNLSPKTNILQWRLKFARNKKRDRNVNKELRRLGWCVIRIWECDLSKKQDHCIRRIRRMITIKSNSLDYKNNSN